MQAQVRQPCVGWIATASRPLCSQFSAFPTEVDTGRPRTLLAHAARVTHANVRRPGPSGIGAGSMLAAARPEHSGAMPAGRQRYCTHGVRVQSAATAAGRADRRPLLPGGCGAVRPTPTLPAGPAALLIVNLGAPFRIRGGADVETAEYADRMRGPAMRPPARGSSATHSGPGPVGVHFKP